MARNTEPTIVAHEPGAFGEEYLAWATYERPLYRRGRLWYWGMTAAALGLLIYAVASANFLFALIIVMCSIVIYLSVVSEPRVVQVTLTDTGVVVGTRFYPYRDMRRFWLVYEPPVVQNLYFELRSPQRRVSVDLGETNPNEIRAVIANFASEDLSDEADEPLTDIVTRILKI